MARRARMFMGLDLNGHFAWRASLPGVDALTNTDQTKFSFNSDWARTGLIHETGIANGSGWVYFAPLPYVPHVVVMRLDGTNLYVGDQSVEDFSMIGAGSGPATACFPSQISTDRFELRTTIHAPTPHIFPYIVFKAPIMGA